MADHLIGDVAEQAGLGREVGEGWLPLGTAYAVWTGVGMVGTALLGIVLFEEPADLVRMLCISVIMAGIVGLKLVSTH